MGRPPREQAVNRWPAPAPTAHTTPVPIDVPLVQDLVRSQLPHLAHLPVRPVPVGGHDNRTFRLGDELTVRLPSAEGYVPAVAKERHWLPVLAPHLPLLIPRPVELGTPGQGYPFSWSVCSWLDGEPALTARIDDEVRFAVDLADFLLALQRVDVAGGPAAGEHSLFRGSPPRHYDGQTRQLVDDLGDRIDRAQVLALWDEALDSTWPGEPVWFHGDVAAGNLLVTDGRLSGVIDFGGCGVGDPACDLVIAFTLLCPGARAAFRSRLGLDDGTWARARGWALWKALIQLDEAPGGGSRDAAGPVGLPRTVIDAVLADAGS